MGNYFGNMMGYGGFGFGFGWILMLLFWGLIIWAIIALARGVSGNGGRGHYHEERRRKEDNALNILKERYAKGEISKEDLERMKKDILA